MKKEIKYLIYFAFCIIVINFIGQQILLYGINKFYGLKQHSELLIIDSSRLMLSIDKTQLEDNTGLLVSKYTREGVSVYDKYYMTKQFLDSEYSDSLKIVLYGVDQFSFGKDKSSVNAYKLFYPFMDNPLMDDYIRANASDWKDYYSHKYFPLNRYTDALINASIRGWSNDYSNKKTGLLDIEEYRKKTKHGRPISLEPNIVAIFEKTMDMITERGVKVLLITTPIVDVLNDFNPQARDEVIQYLEDYTQNNDLIEYWNFCPQYASNYSVFYDPIHLNPYGQDLITEELIYYFYNLNP